MLVAGGRERVREGKMQGKGMTEREAAGVGRRKDWREGERRERGGREEEKV